MSEAEFNDRWRLSRRQFIELMTLCGMASGIPRRLQGAPIAPPLPAAKPSPWPIFRLARPEDHLCVEVELVNLRVVKETGKRARAQQVHIASHSDSGYICLRFPGQHYAEQAVWDRGPQTAPTNSSDDGKGDPPPSVTYQLWRAGIHTNTTSGQDSANHHNDDFAFLRHAPWKVPPPAAKLQNEKGKLYARERDREQRSRWWYQQWVIEMAQENPAPWDSDDEPAGGQWNHEAWTRGAAGLWISGPSQIVFEVPQWRAPFGCDTGTILKMCTQLDMVVAPQLDPTFGRSKPGDQSREPPRLPDVFLGHHPGDSPPYTAIEFPTLLYLSPYQTARWYLRPTVSGGPAELWALELEQSKITPPIPGTPREQRASGHLFAFANRPVQEANWPQDIADTVEQGDPPKNDQSSTKNNKDSRQSDKYSPYESPKTSLYEPTRQLLVAQLRQDNADIVANHFALTALGGAADLQYRPLLDPDGDAPVPEKSVKGFLTEWIQKTEQGRDFYTKEAFAGWWMPWGFKAESVTITERLPTNDPWVETTHGGARFRPRNVLREASLQIPDSDYVDLTGQESHLFALLVARKFARVKPRFPKAGLIREFGPGETEDFLPDGAKAARAAGLRKVEILVERTPVLANQYCDVPDDQFIKYIGYGLDLRVAGGTGENAGQEIFLPRVRDFAQGGDGQLTSRLVPYRFPMRFTYRDGHTEVVEMPMLFVPTLQLGEQLYENLPEALRGPQVRSKVAFVELPAPSAVNTLDLGPAADVIAAKDHYEELLPASATKLLTKGALILKDPEKPASSIVSMAGSLEIIADGLNAFIDGPKETITRVLSQPYDKLETALTGCVPQLQFGGEAVAQLIKGWNDKVDTLEGLLSTAFGKKKEEVKTEVANMVMTLRRHMAWGTDEIVEVDHLFAAERLETLLSFPADVTAWSAKVKASFDAIRAVGQLPSSEADSDEIAAAAKFVAAVEHEMHSVEDAAEKAKTTSAGIQAAYNVKLRNFLLHWATGLTGAWRRHVWDAIFHQISRQFDEGLAHENSAVIAIFKKRLQIGILGGTFSVDLTIKSADESILETIRFQDLVQKPNEQLAGLRTSLSKWLDRVREQVIRDNTAAQRLLRGVQLALPDERGLRLRIQRAIEDLAVRGEAKVAEQLDSLFQDTKIQMSTVIGFDREGRDRFEQFVRNVESAPELVTQARREVLAKYEELQTQVRTTLSDMAIVKNSQSVQKTIQRLLVTTNPDRLRQKLHDAVDLTGHRIYTALQAKLGDLFQAADAQFQRLEALQNQALINANEAAHEGEEALEQLEKLFEIADEVADEYRTTLEKLFEKDRDNLGKVLVEKVQPAVPVEGRSWLNRVAQLLTSDESQRLHSWRLGRAVATLAQDLLNVTKQVRADATRELAAVRREVLGQIAAYAAVHHTMILQEIEQLRGAAHAAGSEFEQRVNALEKWVQDLAGNVPIPDLAGYVLTALLDVRRKAEGSLDMFLGHILGSLAKSALLADLDKEFPAVSSAVSRLRELVGEVEDMEKACQKLTGDANQEATQLWKTISSSASKFGNSLCKDLQDSLSLVEGKAFNLTKRALISLPAPAMLRDFQDQTQKAIFQSSQLVFTAKSLGEGLAKQLAAPQLAKFAIEIPAIEGQQFASYTEDYVNHGLRDFRQAGGAVFATLNNAAASAVESTGIVQAQEKVLELSRELGAVANGVKGSFASARKDAENFIADIRADALDKIKDAKNQFNTEINNLLPTEIPKLLGSLPLDKILGDITDAASLPKKIANQLPDRIERSRTWTKAVSEVDLGVVKFTPTEDPCNFRLDLHSIVYLPIPGRDRIPPAASIRGQLGAFDVTVADLLLIHFRSLSFTAENGSINCVPKLGKSELADVTEIIEFQGALQFLEDVRKALGSLMAESPLRLQVRDDYIFANLVIPVPALGFGAVSITGISFRMGLGLPIGGGSLIYRFALSDRIETFKMSVSGFAGGGFFALELSTDPKNGSLVEGAMEFGGAISLNVAVASGDLSVMGGFYFSRSRAVTTIDAYFRACGRVVVFGFIEIGILIMLSLGYRNEGGVSSLYGEVTVRLRVKIGFFSKSFSFNYSKQFAGSGGGGGGAMAQRIFRERWDRQPLRLAALNRFAGLQISEAPFGGERAGRPYTRPTPPSNQQARPRISPAQDPVKTKTDKHRSDTSWQWGEEPWPTAAAFERPGFALPPRFTETMTPGDWGSYWRLYDWKQFKRRCDHSAPRSGHSKYDERDLTGSLATPPTTRKHSG